MASFRRRKIGEETRWDVTVTKRGAPRQTKTFQRKADAKRWARETERDVERGAWRNTDFAQRTTVAELMTRYSEEVLTTKKAAESLVCTAGKLIRSDLGKLPLIALTPERIAKYRDLRLRSHAQGGGPQGRPQKRLVSSQTVRHEVALLARAIRHGINEWGLHLPQGNPGDTVKLPAPCRARDRRTQGDEYQQLLAAAYGSKSPHLGQALELAVESAMRRGEICNLRWSDIDFTRRVARCRETKNSEPRDVPLSGRAITVLQALPRSITDGPVFKLKGRGFTQAFKRLCSRLGIENLRLHDLRHEGTSRLAERLNGDVMALSAITGHKTLQMLKRYTHLKPEDLARRIA